MSDIENILKHRIVHLDLKGAPPKLSYYEKIFPLLHKWGATGLLLEYEDMFPYTDNLQVIRSPYAYCDEDITRILQLAEDNNLIVIPLVQTFGHFEFVLKHSEFCSIREVPEYPMSLCPSKYDSLSVVQQMIDQIMKLHPSIKWFHIGCDEVYHLGLCNDCKRIMNKENLSAEQIFFSHVSSVATYIRDKYPGVIPIIWDDMFRFTELPILKESGLGELVEPMVWHYLTKFMLPPGFFDRLSEVFPNIWFASAYKGATGSATIVTNISYHIDNHLAWLNAIENEKSKFKNIQGVVLTGWQRYDHFAILCELLPQALPCLVVCLQIMMKGTFTAEMHLNISKELHFPSYLPLMPFNIGSEKIVCCFPGSDVYCSILSWIYLTRDIDAFLNSTGLFTWMNDYHLKRYYTNPNHIEPMVNEATRLLNESERLKTVLYNALEEVYFLNTVDEWLGVHVLPRYDKLKTVVDSGIKQLEYFKQKINQCNKME